MTRKPQRRPESEKTPAYRAGERVGAWSTRFIMVYLVAAGAFLLGVTSLDGPLAIVLWVVFVFFTAFVLLAAIATRDVFWVSLIVYVLIVIIGSRVQTMEPKPEGVLIAIAAGSVLAAIVFMVSTLRRGRAATELDQLLFSQSTSIAFFVTMIAALTYSLLESWVDAPKLSMWLVWTIGMCSWAVLSIVIGRRYT